MGLDGAALPDFPWDALAPAKRVAGEHPDGIVDLSVGTPVDPTPLVARNALSAASDNPGYPQTVGTPELRGAMVSWFARRRGVTDLPESAVLPTVGSKEAVALLPALLGLGRGAAVLHPQVAYPTYDVGARLAGATPAPVGMDPAQWPEEVEGAPVRLVWLNSPGNPHGHVLDVNQLAAIVSWARARGAVVAADECYAELGWSPRWQREQIPSLLDPRVSGGDLSGLLVLYSLSKQSNLAGYRAALIAGDPKLVGMLREVRRHAGMMMPGPIQAAMAAALDDDTHVAQQKEQYRRRREVLLEATGAAGLEADPGTEAGLYLWLRAAEGGGASADGEAVSAVADGETGSPGSWALVEALSARGILVAPGLFYGPGGEGYVRMALTAGDERIDAAASRLHQGGPLVT